MAEGTSQHGQGQKIPEKPHVAPKEAPLPPPPVFEQPKSASKVEPLPPPPHTTHTTLEEDFDVDAQLLTPEEERALHEHKELVEKQTGKNHPAEQKAPSTQDHSVHQEPKLTMAKPSRFTRRQIFGWVISVIILGAIIWGLIWGFSFVWHFFQNLDSSSSTTTSTQTHQQTQSSTDTSSTQNTPGWIHPSVYSSLLIGTVAHVFQGTTGVDTNLALGATTQTITSHLEEGLALVKKISSALHTDLRQMLNNTSARAKALDDYVALLQDDRTRVVQLQEDLEAQITDLQTSFATHAVDQKTAEDSFFSAFDAYDATTAQSALDTFIATQQETSKEKAFVKAFSLLDQLYTTAIDTLDLHIKDITANRAALLEGIQVVDIQGSDLNLILSEQDLSQ